MISQAPDHRDRRHEPHAEQFEGERERIIKRKVTQGYGAEQRYGENPDFYDTFFVPEQARWTHLQARLNDAAKPFDSRLDEALAALTESNEAL